MKATFLACVMSRSVVDSDAPLSLVVVVARKNQGLPCSVSPSAVDTPEMSGRLYLRTVSATAPVAELHSAPMIATTWLLLISFSALPTDWPGLQAPSSAM